MGEGQVAGVRGEAVAAAMEPDDEFAGGRVAEPEGAGAAGESKGLGGEVVFGGVGGVGFGEGWGDCSRG